MARNRITFFFRSTRGYGWSETYFTTAASLNGAMTNAKAILPTRVNLNGRGVFLEFIRVSDDEVRRDSQIYVVPRADREIKARSAGDGDIANTCVDVRIEAGDTKRRTLFLRGIPDDICLDNGSFVPTPAWNANFGAFSAALGMNQIAVRVRTDVSPQFVIANVGTSGPTGLVTITTQAATGFVLNDVVNIRQVLGATQVRGLQRVVTIIDATNFQVRVARVVKPYLGGGLVVKNGYALLGISALHALRCSHHNAGRPFDSPRGRRRAT